MLDAGGSDSTHALVFNPFCFYELGWNDVQLMARRILSSFINLVVCILLKNISL